MDVAQAVICPGNERFGVGNDDVQPFQLLGIVLGIIVFCIYFVSIFRHFVVQEISIAPGTISSFANLTKLSPSTYLTTFAHT